MIIALADDYLIEGLGNEVIIASVIGIILLLIFTFMRFDTQSNQIHPESARLIEGNREQIPRRSSDTQANETNELNCPVCLATAHFAIETNCGHKFCGNCIISYWEHGHWLGAVKCPVCRQQVTILLLYFTENEIIEHSEEKTRICDKIREYNRRFSGEPREIWEYICDLPTLLRHCLHDFFTFNGLVLMFRVRIIVIVVIAFIYFVSPLDIIPEAVFGILGLFDDLLVICLLAIYISIMYRRLVAETEE